MNKYLFTHEKDGEIPISVAIMSISLEDAMFKIKYNYNRWVKFKQNGINELNLSLGNGITFSNLEKYFFRMSAPEPRRGGGGFSLQGSFSQALHSRSSLPCDGNICASLINVSWVKSPLIEIRLSIG